jgi:hypothetical protein
MRAPACRANLQKTLLKPSRQAQVLDLIAQLLVVHYLLLNRKGLVGVVGGGVEAKVLERATSNARSTLKFLKRSVVYRTNCLSP